ncbi:MAG: PAS domain-containing protein [Gemmatimonadota bacterium]
MDVDGTSVEVATYEARWRSLEAMAPFHVATVSEDGRLASLNQALGAPAPAEALGRPIEDLLPAEQVGRARTALEHTILTRQPLTLQVQIPVRDQSSRWLDIHLGPLIEGDRVVGAIAIGVDITEIKQAESELRMSVNALHRLGEEREGLAADLHDGILQSLYGVGLRIEAARVAHRNGNAELEEHFARAISQLNDTMKEIRGFIKEGMGSLPNEIRLADALGGVIRGLEVTGGPSIELTVDPAAVGVLSPAAQAALLPIAREAVSNAVRHATAAKIRVQIRRERELVRFEVADDGTGYAPDPATRGYGVFNLSRRAAQVGGVLTILTAPGEGTRVRVDFPARS